DGPRHGRSRSATLPLHSTFGVPLGPSVDSIRVVVAGLVWALAVAAACVLGLAALLVAAGLDTDQVVVAAVVDTARSIDGPFGALFTFTTTAPDGTTTPDVVKNAL